MFTESDKILSKRSGVIAINQCVEISPSHKCKYCDGNLLPIEDYQNRKYKIINDEFGHTILSTINGEPVIRLSFCPKCGSNLD